MISTPSLATTKMAGAVVGGSVYFHSAFSSRAERTPIEAWMRSNLPSGTGSGATGLTCRSYPTSPPLSAVLTASPLPALGTVAPELRPLWFGAITCDDHRPTAPRAHLGELAAHARSPGFSPTSVRFIGLHGVERNTGSSRRIFGIRTGGGVSGVSRARNTPVSALASLRLICGTGSRTLRCSTRNSPK